MIKFKRIKYSKKLLVLKLRNSWCDLHLGITYLTVHVLMWINGGVKSLSWKTSRSHILNVCLLSGEDELAKWPWPVYGNLASPAIKGHDPISQISFARQERDIT